MPSLEPPSSDCASDEPVDADDEAAPVLPLELPVVLSPERALELDDTVPAPLLLVVLDAWRDVPVAELLLLPLLEADPPLMPPSSHGPRGVVDAGPTWGQPSLLQVSSFSPSTEPPRSG